MTVTRSALGLLLGVVSLAPLAWAGGPGRLDSAPVTSASGLVSIVTHGDRGPSRGAGFVARADGLVVTARSLVDDGRPVLVELACGRTLPAHRLAVDRDLALLRVEAAGLTPAPIATTTLAPGASLRLGPACATLGGRLEEPAPRRDLLAAWTPSPDAFRPGAPLTSSDGEVVGVALAVDELPFLGPCLACVTAAPAEQVRRLLDRADRPLPAIGPDLRWLRPWFPWDLHAAEPPGE